MGSHTAATPQWLYVLRCEGDRYYVGTTGDVTARFLQHWGGSGSVWTKTYRPIEAVLVQADKTTIDEDATVKRYMAAHGVAAVRGGSYPQLRLDKGQLEALERELNHARGCCFRCGSEDHWASACRLTTLTTSSMGTSPARGKPAQPVADKTNTGLTSLETLTEGVHTAKIGEAQVAAPGPKAKAPYCVRCGRSGHVKAACYAKTFRDGTPLQAEAQPKAEGSS